ncbi:Receptor-like protein 12 [Camellia lanceoleosa]|uniref:Receptor-like protein 12 n=1 Tax=Camellia lanceoleosa TaxID=1840588 RepID=A0ACC0G1S8_9ERIC|nr:Receptor-like protein 12 [Camellia lanceoleosa]
MGTTSSALLMLFAFLFMEGIEFCCSSTNPNVSCIASEREALIEFKGKLKDDANRLSTWVGKDCCLWKGVSCSRKTGHVMKLDLRNPIPFDSYKGDFIQHSANFDKNRLSGEISPSLLVLNHLSYIDLSMNNFSDMQFPEFFGSMKSLRYLDLSWSQFFSGMIPHHLGNLSRLQYLNLSNNALVGPIPDTLGRLISLTVLDLSFNDFDNSMLHCLSNLSSLVHMDIGSNYFNSLIPDALGRSTALTFLDLSDNNLDNSLLCSLCNLTGLVHLDLGFNYLHGSIPYCFGKLPSISVLKLDYNSFQDPIPSEIGNMTQLTELHFTRNKFKGEIPNSMWRNLCNLRVLDLSNNKFKGEIPTPCKTSVACAYLIYPITSSVGTFLLCCVDDKSSFGNQKHADESNVADETDFLWFYTGIGPGFLVRFLGVCGTLNFKKSWRYAYFQFIENNYNWISINIAIKFAQLRRKFNKGKFGG